MADTYNLSTDIGKVRLLIRDTDVGGTVVFSDAEITTFLDLEDTVRTAAALALESLAGDSARLAKALKTMNWSEDTTVTATQLLAVAKRLREGDEAPAVAIAEIGGTSFGDAAICENYWARLGL